jgi:hypothetical protein
VADTDNYHGQPERQPKRVAITQRVTKSISFSVAISQSECFSVTVAKSQRVGFAECFGFVFAERIAESVNLMIYAVTNADSGRHRQHP